MKKKLCVIIVSLLGIILAPYLIVISSLIKARLLLFFISALIIIVSIALLMKPMKLVYIIIRILSVCWLVFYAFLIYIWGINQFHYSWGTALVAYFPFIIWSLVSLFVLRKVDNYPTNQSNP